MDNRPITLEITYEDFTDIIDALSTKIGKLETLVESLEIDDGTLYGSVSDSAQYDEIVGLLNRFKLLSRTVGEQVNRQTLPHTYAKFATFAVGEIEYTFSYTEREEVEVVAVEWTANGESFRQWSAEAPFPRTCEEAKTALLEFGWSEGWPR